MHHEAMFVGTWCWLSCSTSVETRLYSSHFRFKDVDICEISFGHGPYTQLVKHVVQLVGRKW